METPERIALKSSLRNELLDIGIQAIRHALRFDPSAEVKQTVNRYIALFQVGEPGTEIRTLNKYCRDNSFLYALAGLQLLVTETRTPRMHDLVVHHVFLPCWDSGIFTSYPELHAETDWQDQNLRPLIDAAFEQWRKADARLKREQEKSKAESKAK